MKDLVAAEICKRLSFPGEKIGIIEFYCRRILDLDNRSRFCCIICSSEHHGRRSEEGEEEKEAQKKNKT